MAPTFPRTMAKGIFKGRHFESQKEYQKAVAEVRKTQRKRGQRTTPVVSGDEFRFTLRIVAGSLEFSITGDPRRPEDIDRMLEALSAFGSGA